MTPVYDYIYDTLTERKIAVKEFAEGIGIHYSTFYKWKRLGKDVCSKYFDVIAKYLGVSVDTLTNLSKHDNVPETSNSNSVAETSIVKNTFSDSVSEPEICTEDLYAKYIKEFKPEFKKLYNGLTLSNRIKYILYTNNIEESEFYADLGLPNNFLFEVRKGFKPDLNMLLNIADYLTTSIDYLTGRVDLLSTFYCIPDNYATELEKDIVKSLHKVDVYDKIKVLEYIKNMK